MQFSLVKKMMRALRAKWLNDAGRKRLEGLLKKSRKFATVYRSMAVRRSEQIRESAG
jgi:hypothetical protein